MQPREIGWVFPFHLFTRNDRKITLPGKLIAKYNFRQRESFRQEEKDSILSLTVPAWRMVFGKGQEQRGGCCNYFCLR